MRLLTCFLAVALSAATTAMAQPAGQAEASACTADIAALERDMDAARSKGQMLRRRQLEAELTALQQSCAARPGNETRAGDIARLEQEIRDLRLQLEQAEERLRGLKTEAN